MNSVYHLIWTGSPNSAHGTGVTVDLITTKDLQLSLRNQFTAAFWTPREITVPSKLSLF